MTRLLTAPGSPVDDHVQAIGRRTRSEARLIGRGRLTRRTGRYDDGFQLARTAHPLGPACRVWNTSPVSLLLELGSRPHPIVPRGPGYPLRFTIRGQQVYAWRVQHPGTRPYRILTDALTRAVAASN